MKQTKTNIMMLYFDNTLKFMSIFGCLFHLDPVPLTILFIRVYKLNAAHPMRSGIQLIFLSLHFFIYKND